MIIAYVCILFMLNKSVVRNDHALGWNDVLWMILDSLFCWSWFVCFGFGQL
jgi:hypothetical protein